MSSRAVVFDSPPVEIPSVHPRLKRSSSTASLASLPTPPRTIHKRKRSHSKASSAFDSGDESDGSVSSKPATNKRRKLVDTAKKDAAEEQAFWLDHDAGPPKFVVRPCSPKPTRSMSPELGPSSYRAQKTGLVSPPPSRRQPARKVKKPVTPNPSPKASTSKQPRVKGKGKALKEMPIRDSPNNPFLDHDDSSLRMKTPPRRNIAPEERPTLTYVFRGQKQEMINPMYKYKPSANSLLPPEHPDFSPDVACPPKLLFPEAHRRRQQPPRILMGRSPSPSSDFDSDDEDGPSGVRAVPMAKLEFGDKLEARAPKAAAESQRVRQKKPATNR